MPDRLHVEITGDSRDLQNSVRLSKASIRDLGQEIRRQNAELAASNRQVSSNTKTWGLFGGEIKKVAFGLMALNAGPAIAGLVDLGAAAVGLTSSLASLAPAAVVIPAGLSAIGQAAGTVKLATEGVSQALHGNKKAFDKLTPSAKHFVETLKRDWEPALDRLKTKSQEDFFHGVTSGLRAAKQNLPEFSHVIEDTSKTLGDAAKQWGKFLGSDSVGRDITTQGRRNNVILKDTSSGMLNLADATRHVVSAGGPLVHWMDQTVLGWTKQAAGAAKAARENGTLARVFQGTRHELELIGGLIGHTGGALFGVGKQALPFGNDLLSGLDDTMAHLSELANSPQGQRAMHDFFASAEPPLKATAHLAGDLLVAMAEITQAANPSLTRLANTLDREVLPTLKALILDVTHDLLPGLLDGVDGLSHLVHELEPGLKPVLSELGTLLHDLGVVAHLVGDLSSGLPGIAKLIPALTIGAAVLLGWKQLRASIGAIGPAFRRARAEAAGFQQVASKPSAPSVAPVIAVPAGVPTLATAAARETRTPGGVILPAGRTAWALEGAGGAAAAGRFAGVTAGLKAAVKAAAPAAATLFAVQFGLSLQSALSQKGSTGDKFQTFLHGATLGITPAPKLSKTGIPAGAGGFDHFARSLGENLIHPFSIKTGDADKTLRQFGDTADKTFAKLQKQSNVGGMRDLANQARELAVRFPKAADALNKFADDVQATAQPIAEMENNIRSLKNGVFTDLGTVKKIFSEDMDTIARTMGVTSARGANLASQNIGGYVTNIKALLRAHVIDAKTAFKAIEDGFIAYGAKFGLTPADVKSIHQGTSAHGGHAQARGGFAGSGPLIQLGKPGEGGRDSIPMNLGGVPVIAAPGEQIAVLTRHQQADLGQMVAERGYTGGLPDYFSKRNKPNYMAGGGIVPIPGQGQSIDRRILPDVEAIIRKYRAHVSAGYAPTGHAAGGEHPLGLAVDLVPGAGGSWDLIDKLAHWAEPSQNHPRSPFRWVGYDGDAGHGRGNHLHLSWMHPGGKVMTLHGLLGALGHVKIPKLKGHDDAFKVIAQAAVDRVGKGANKRLDELMPAGGVDLGGSLSAASKKGDYNLTALKGLWVQAGGDPRKAAIMAHIAMAESAGNIRAHNASGASGLWQILGQVVRGNIFDPIVNARNAIKKSANGRNLHPWDASRAAWGRFLAKGGLIGAAEGLLTGDVEAANVRGHIFQTPQSKKRKRGQSRTQHYNPFTGRYESMTADQYQALKDRWYHGHPREAMPTSPHRAHSKPKKKKPAKHKPRLSRAVRRLAGKHRYGFHPDLAGAEKFWDGLEGLSGKVDSQALPHLEHLLEHLHAEYLVDHDQDPNTPDAVNQSGLTVDGKRIPGIDQAVEILNRELSELGTKEGYLHWEHQAAEATLDQIRKAIKERQKVWDQMVKKVKANATRIRETKSRLRTLGKIKKPSKAQHKEAGALRSEMADLQREQKALTGSEGPDPGKLRELTSTDTPIGTVRSELNDYAESRDTWRERLVDLDPTGLGKFSELHDSMDVIRDRIAEATGTKPPKADSTAVTGEDKGVLADLLRQQLTTTQQNLRLSEAELATFRGFNPVRDLVGGLGGFARGTSFVERTGLALIHEGEQIRPAPDGPYSAGVNYGQGPAPVVHVEIHNDPTGAVRMVKAAIDGQAAPVVSRQVGRDARQLSVAPGR